MIAKPRNSLRGEHEKGCLRLCAGSPTSLAESHHSSVLSAGWVRRGKAELLLMRPAASPPCLFSPASFLTISYLLTALPLAELPLRSAALGAQMHMLIHVLPTQSLQHTTHRCTRATCTQAQTHTLIGMHTCSHFTPMCMHNHAHMFTHSHISSHSVFSEHSNSSNTLFFF